MDESWNDPSVIWQRKQNAEFESEQQHPIESEQSNPEVVVCPECRGRGVLIDRLEPCGECNGIGYIANGKEWCANESERSGDYPCCLNDCPDISVCPHKCS